MDRQEYLNQISAENQAKKSEKSKKNFLKSKYFIIGVVFVVALIFIMILGGIISGTKGSGKENTIALKLHIDNVMSTISSYQQNIKSSVLRADNASLLSILSNTNGNLNTYITERYTLKEGDIAKSLSQNKIDELTLQKDGVEAELFEAKINGIFDRIYAHKMTYEITLIMNEESQVYNSTSDDNLKSIIITSYNSLENLYNKFSNFSEAK